MELNWLSLLCGSECLFEAPTYSSPSLHGSWVTRRILGICVPFVACEIVTRQTPRSEGRSDGNSSTASSREFGNVSMSSVKFHHLYFVFIADTSCGSHVAQFNCREILSRIKTPWKLYLIAIRHVNIQLRFLISVF